MDFSEILSFGSILVQIIFLEGILSLDNAAVLGAIVLGLPANENVPWPKALRFLARPLNPLLGKQRTAGLRVGLLGAYLGRGLMLVMASFVIRNVWLQLLGALYLLKISTAELSALGSNEEGDEAGQKDADYARKSAGRSFWATVLMVEMMDLAFSLDNVVVVVSLTDQLWLVMLGVAVGILTMRFAAGVFTKLIERIPSLGPAAYVLVFNIGLEFVLARILNTEIPEFVRFSVNLGTLLLAVIYDRSPWLRRLAQLPFHLMSYIFVALDRLFYFVFYPIGWLFSRISRLFQQRLQPSTVQPKVEE